MKQLIFIFFGMLWAGVVLSQEPKWKEMQTPVKASLRGLSPVSDRVCWASGSNGTWLKTTDGGESWEHGVIADLDTVDFRSIHAFDEFNAVAASAGQPAVIYLTSDGGKSWEKVHEEGPSAFFDGISFLDKKRGYVIGDPVNGNWMILETLDGGESWKALSNSPQAESGEAAFAASASSLIATKGGLIFGTGGSVSNLHFYDFESKTWEKEKTPILQGEPSQGIFAITQVNDKVIAVGGDYTKLDQRERSAVMLKDRIFESPEILPSGFRSGVVFYEDKNQLVAVGPSGSDFSLDQGITWTNFSSIGYHTVKISPKKKTIWASGSSGRVGILIL
jgi:photosystem II stability/assembly factor-like uncharacterized protein